MLFSFQPNVDDSFKKRTGAFESLSTTLQDTYARLEAENVIIIFQVLFLYLCKWNEINDWQLGCASLLKVLIISRRKLLLCKSVGIMIGLLRPHPETPDKFRLSLSVFISLVTLNVFTGKRL